MSRIVANHWVAILLGLVTASPVPARQIDLDVSMAHPQLLADKKQTTFIKVGLTGFELVSDEERAPVNLALVIDKSGSMSGEKLERAREAAISALERLNSKDIVSVIAYDSNVTVVVPATKLSDRTQIIEQIREIQAGGSTALFAGVSKGADELRKFLDKERVNRVVLLSDGLANVGPQSPSELGELGKSLSKEGITVTTIGLGLDYNEDLMTKLAQQSDGNHVFVESSSQLVEVFNREFNDVLSVVAQEVVINIKCRDDVRPVRVLNTDAEITGQDVYVKLNQLYSQQEKYVVLEIEVPAGKNGTTMDIASVEVTYTNMETNTDDRLTSDVGVRFSANLAEVRAATNSKVMVGCVVQLANLKNQHATLLRDQGKIAESEQLLKLNAAYLRENAALLKSDLLLKQANENEQQVELVRDNVNWKRGRKLMRAKQYQTSNQQAAPR